eukprot:TRINITY_DN1149_c0_g1_i1.p1 TRINITY_DN1149_c0_g1~~TRINITY_DN1149_c0_g1_i1.p1  ORF type:complete len:114 (+),score=27.16 TRINITY_DN1149_c0_g1_i1:54-344(+)
MFGKLRTQIGNPARAVNLGRFINYQEGRAKNTTPLEAQKMYSQTQNLFDLKKSALYHQELKVKYAGRKLTRRQELEREAATVGLALPKVPPPRETD